MDLQQQQALLMQAQMSKHNLLQQQYGQAMMQASRQMFPQYGQLPPPMPHGMEMGGMPQ